VSAASVYLRDGLLLFFPTHVADTELLVDDPECEALPETATPREKGELLLRTVAKCRRDVPAPPPDRDDALPPWVLERAGARRWQDYMKGARVCDVEEGGRQFAFTPMGPVRGSRYGFEPVEGAGRNLLTWTDPGEVGLALEAALARAVPGRW
jgi:hypothetical protein